MRPRTISLAVLLLSVSAGGLYWSQRDSTAAVAAPATTTVVRSDVEQTVLASGVVEAARLVSVGARTSGQIETLAVALGDRVAEGQVIATIDSSDQQNDVMMAQASLDQINAQIASQEAQIASLRTEAERQQELRDRGINAQTDIETAAANLLVAEAGLNALQAQLAQAEIELATAQTALDRTQITSPVEGTVVAIVNGEGTTVNASNEAPTIVKIADLNSMHVIASVSETDVSGVEPGDTVNVTLPGVPGQTFEALLDSVAPAPASIAESDDISADQAIYYEAQLTLPNDDGALRIGMTAEVSIVLDSAQDTLSIPLAALESEGLGSDGQVTVWDDGSQTAEPRAIQLGVVSDETAQVLDGLAEGEKVVLASAPTGPAVPASPGGGAGAPGGMRPPGGSMGF